MVYEYVHEIQKATGWSQQRIGAETGLGLSTISRIFRVPNYAGNEISKTLITRLYREIVASPFPAYLENLFLCYDEWREKFSKKEFSDHLAALEALLLHHKEIDGQSLGACRLHWLLGHISFDRAFYLKYDPVRSAAQALKQYQQALDILGHYTDSHLRMQRYKLQQCIVSTNFNSCEPGRRAKNPEIRRWLESMNYLQLVEQVIAEDPWNWMAARNGLVAASILQNRDKSLLFWNALHAVHKHFQDPDYTPTNDMPAVADDPDIEWFTQNVL